MEEDLRLCRELFRVEVPAALEYAGCLAMQMGYFDQAIELFHRGMENGIQIKSFPQASYMAWMEGCAALAKGRTEHLLRLREGMLLFGRETGTNDWFLYADALLVLLEWLQGEFDCAEKRVEESLARYSGMDFGFALSFPYVSGRVALARGDLVKAERYFRQLDEMANAPPLWRWKPVSLHVFGLLAATQSRQHLEMAERAAMLFGAQEKLFSWLPNFLAPMERQKYAEALEIARAALGEEAFLAAWASGQAMSHQQAFLMALQKLGQDMH